MRHLSGLPNRNMGKQDNLEGQYLIPHIGSHSTTPVMRAQ